MIEHHQDRLTALQLYFPGASRARVTSFWHHLSAPALAQHLLKVAQKAKIEQVMLKTISAGYLPSYRISHHHPELGDMRHPQCLELLDTEDKLRAFLRDHADELRKVRAVLLLCELPLTDAS
ncbi:hypothetical protein ACTACM_13460 [Pseudomonas fragariae (ex Marin et al. 2024)]|uniref:Alkylphosphonate utilization operon protein PhnA n=2 Tax=Pseudomonas TaxID=286 RepID=A0A0P9YEZ6_9PSED|nr:MULTISPECIES: hypothetical protein [Pseudomonas]KPY36398.1 hypothetical protein ALO52_200033 [Pseudomonas syringae pv. primulae]MBC2680773.1 hypothetical protein [Pseudomonas baltica]MCD5969907.1 hypothetical protein [Pseudomonas quasicaspiana]MCF5734226.1 hypothetical protein [Pseudomonas syringae]MCF5742519.1 hypothetical protein [Pseudomonas syringae]